MKNDRSRPGANPGSSSDLRRLNRIAEQLGTVRREGLTEQLVQKLANLVLRGVLSPGDALPPERELSQMLGVSRSSLRQALKAMQVMGVLGVRQGSGNYLTHDAKEILSLPAQVLLPLPGLSQAELLEVRRALEAESAASAAERATATDLEKIRTEFEHMKNSVNDTLAYRNHDLAFHQAIAAAAGNRFFVWFLALANKVLYQALLARPMKVSLPNSVKEHENILRAIEARDSAGARLEMLRHVSHQKYYMLDQKRLTDVRFVAYESGPGRAPEESRDEAAVKD